MKYYAIKTSYGFQVLEAGTAGRHYGIGDIQALTEAQASVLINMLGGIFKPYEPIKLEGFVDHHVAETFGELSI